MKRILMSATAAVGLLAAASAASAQTISTGTVVLNGTVSSKCTVISTGTTTGAGGTGSGSVPAGAQWGDTINLGEIAGNDGLLRSDLDGSVQASPSTTTTAQVNCTGANMGVSVTATPLANTSVATAPAGFSRLVNFTGEGQFERISPTSAVADLVVPDDSAVAGATTGSFGASNFLNPIAGNVRITTYNYNTDANQSDVLVAGGYQGQVVVTITPS